jgi:hypothetical protein
LGAAKPTTCEAIAHDDDARTTQLIVVRGEITAERRTDAQCAEVARRDELTDELLGVLHIGERGSPVVDRGDRHNRVHARRKLAEGPISRRNEAAARAAVGDGDQPIAIRVWQRGEQNRIDRAEYRSRGANAERQRENGDDREARMVAEAANSESDVGHDAVDGILPAV